MDAGKRDASLDVIRCMAMFLIVLGHVYQHGMNYHVSKWFDLVFWTFLCWHVDAFLALSGWFGIKFTIKKFMRLWGVIAFYSIVSFVIGRWCLGMSVPFRITGGWYGNTYLCLMLVAPILNSGIDGLIAKGSKLVWFAWCGFAAVVWINWVSGNSYIGLVAYGVGSFSFVQMMFVYLTVRFVRLTCVSEKVKMWHLISGIVVFIACSIAMPPSRTNYIAPHTVAMSVVMLLLFEKYVRVPNWLGSVCVWAAPSMFGVYLLHEVTSFGKVFHRAPIRFVLDAYPIFSRYPQLAILVGATICFVACLAIESTRRLLVNKIVIAVRFIRRVV